jgi:hypothetical protein
MTWELYEVWAVAKDGSEDLVETTNSLKEAKEIAEVNIGDDIVECVIYREDDNGDLHAVETVK